MPANNESGVFSPQVKVAHTIPLWSLLPPIIFFAVIFLITMQQPDGRLHMWVLDVGQGDSILLRTPKGHTALIDGGPAATPVLNGIGANLPFWRRDLDLLVLTHPHEDHMMGFGDVLAHYRIDEVVQTEFTATSGVQAVWLASLTGRKVPVHYAQRGETIGFEGEPDVALHILSPVTPNAAREGQGGDINNTSIVLKLDYGKHGILLEGDAQDEAEGEMVAHEKAELGSEVLKVGHHGSRTSSSPRFLANVKPKIAIISVGQGNKFGHPAQETLDALRKAGATVYRTDMNGTVEVIADTENMWVRSERP